MVAALGGVERKGRWIPARTSYAIALMGGLSLDFREALLPPGETEVWIFTLMGGAEIIVPPGLTVRDAKRRLKEIRREQRRLRRGR